MEFVEFRYDDSVDERLIPLYNSIQSLPGIEITCLERNLHNNFSIWIGSNSYEGLFFLTRSIDNRYSNGNWKIELSVGDLFIDGHFPITYRLYCNRGLLNDEIVTLVDNMYHNLNHYGFMNGYNLTDIFETHLDQLSIRERIDIRDNQIDILID